MPEPILTTAVIASALGFGLTEVAKVFVKKAAEPPAIAVAKPISSWLNKKHDQKRLEGAVKAAFAAIEAPEDDDALLRYARRLGFDQLQAAGNDQLRQEVARAALLMTEPDPQLIPTSLYNDLRWPHENRPILATFLFTLRHELETDEDWGPLVKQSNEQVMRDYLRQSTLTLDGIKGNFDELLAYYNLTPDKEDGLALEEYLAYVSEEHSHTSFLFIKPAGRRDQLTTEAELEAVFVPLQVQDPQAEDEMRRQMERQQKKSSRDKEEAVYHNLTINEVLAKHPVFLLRGRPGSGKTTLLRHLATCFANSEAASKLDWQGVALLPILVPLRNFGRFLQDHPKEYTSPAPLPLRDFIEDYFRENLLDLPLHFFRDRLQQGRCLVMLDGLDEVADPGLRARVARIVDSFIKKYSRNGNRFALASRAKGYEEVAIHLKRPIVCNVQPLTPQGRDELVHRLLKQFVPNKRRCRKETGELLRDIRNKERVEELSRNPLFCTTLVLVYKYRGTTLPERRVDVYQELVTLMLGFWETHREGVSDVRELAIMDGTGRAFPEEKEAVEAKKRALINLADWMQHEGKAEVEKGAALHQLARYFHDREGATGREAPGWARGFLNVAHQRSGLFIEVNPDTYTFSHQNFREYLAATAVINRTDSKMMQTVLANAGNAWWEEVILLAAAHENLSDQRRELLLKQMIEADHLLLAGRCAVDAGARLPVPLRRDLRRRLHKQMIDASLPPPERFNAGVVLDKLGWLPPDLNAWLRCPATADDKRDLLVMKYPVTNSQYAPFIAAGSYDKSRYWGGEESEAWQWRKNEGVDRPRFWYNLELGKERQGFPVVGVSWYEAAAYAAWLTDLLGRAAEKEEEAITEQEQALIADLLTAGAREVRLPSDDEWTRLAGGKANGRYPWDRPKDPVTELKEIITQRANVWESEISSTSPVGMYPQGAGHPFGLMDLAGNVWEWINDWYYDNKSGRVLRGGPWDLNQLNARVAVRDRFNPHVRDDIVGFRLVSPSFLDPGS